MITVIKAGSGATAAVRLNGKLVRFDEVDGKDIAAAMSPEQREGVRAALAKDPKMRIAAANASIQKSVKSSAAREQAKRQAAADEPLAGMSPTQARAEMRKAIAESQGISASSSKPSASTKPIAPVNVKAGWASAYAGEAARYGLNAQENPRPEPAKPQTAAARGWAKAYQAEADRKGLK